MYTRYIYSNTLVARFQIPFTRRVKADSQKNTAAKRENQRGKSPPFPRPHVLVLVCCGRIPRLMSLAERYSETRVLLPTVDI